MANGLKAFQLTSVHTSSLVLVTRPQREARLWVESLRAAGWDAHSLPLMAIGAIDDATRIMQTWGKIDSFDALMFVSANAVHYFFENRNAKPQQGKWRAFVTGQGSRKALIERGFPPQRIDCPAPDAEQFDSETLWEIVAPQITTNFKVLVVRGLHSTDIQSLPSNSNKGNGRDWFAEQCIRCGASVDWVVAYKSMPPIWNPHDVHLAQSVCIQGGIWLFSSSQALMNLQMLREPSGPLFEYSTQLCRAVATHPRIAQAATHAGFNEVITCNPSMEKVLATIELHR